MRLFSCPGSSNSWSEEEQTEPVVIWGKRRQRQRLHKWLESGLDLPRCFRLGLRSRVSKWLKRFWGDSGLNTRVPTNNCCFEVTESLKFLIHLHQSVVTCFVVGCCGLGVWGFVAFILGFLSLDFNSVGFIFLARLLWCEGFVVLLDIRANTRKVRVYCS